MRRPLLYVGFSSTILGTNQLTTVLLNVLVHQSRTNALHAEHHLAHFVKLQIPQHRELLHIIRVENCVLDSMSKCEERPELTYSATSHSPSKLAAKQGGLHDLHKTPQACCPSAITMRNCSTCNRRVSVKETGLSKKCSVQSIQSTTGLVLVRTG
jgi:hypothetical protein